MKRRIALFLIICLLLSFCCCGSKPGSVEGRGFNSAEDAALAYAEALKTGNIDKILSTFAVETYVENYDLEKYVAYCHTIFPGNMEIPFENLDSFTKGVNVISRQSTIIKQLTNMYLTLSDLEDPSKSQHIGASGYQDASDLLDDLMIRDWAEMLEEMEIDEVLEFSDLPLDDGGAAYKKQIRKNLRDKADYLDCDEVVSMAVEVSFDRDDYYLCIEVGCYDGKWYNILPGTYLVFALGGDSSCGGLVPCDP